MFVPTTRYKDKHSTRLQTRCKTSPTLYIKLPTDCLRLALDGRYRPCYDPAIARAHNAESRSQFELPGAIVFTLILTRTRERATLYSSVEDRSFAGSIDASSSEQAKQDRRYQQCQQPNPSSNLARRRRQRSRTMGWKYQRSSV